MSSTHSAEFKAKVALEAVSRNNELIAEIATKYDITEDEVRSWTEALQNKAANLFDASSTATTSEVSDVTIDSEDEIFIHSVNHGVQDDIFNYQKLFFWSGLGVVTVLVFIVALVYFAEFSFYNAQQEASITSTYSEITNLNANQTETLNSFGVVDLEDGVYRIPIEEAINKIAVD